MIYNSFQDIKLSALGMGCMRLPVIGDDNTVIDEALTEKMVAYAMSHGINYYDTAWGYHGGNSELVIGKALSQYPRDSFYLASKFPGYDLSNMDKVESIFEEQLKKCRVDYFDFYLFHNVNEKNIDAYLDDEQFGIFSYLVEQKKAGRIRHLGFSTHGTPATMKRFLDAYSSELEFCQIQLNWLDWEMQDAKAKVELIRSYGLPIWVMEPVRGGKLASLNADDTATLQALRPEETAPGWAFRFLQSIGDVTVTLSGMSDYEQMVQNIATCEVYAPVAEQEREALFTIAHRLSSTVPCTACSYCVPYCPQGLEIPNLIKLYNENAFTGGSNSVRNAVLLRAPEKRPSACLACRSCEEVCPQNIHVSEIMAKFAAKVES